MLKVIFRDASYAKTLLKRALAAEYEVRGIPCFVVVKGGREVARRTGAVPKSEMRRMLRL